LVLLPASLEANFRSEIEPCISGASFSDSSFRFVRYNGLTEATADALLRERPFEGAVVIVDEAHNFVQGAANGGVLRRLYEAIVAARGCKVMLLSGTPLVNSAHEVAFMINMVAGLERTRIVTLGSPLPPAQLESLKRCPYLRSVETTVTGRGLLPAVRLRLVEPDNFILKGGALVQVGHDDVAYGAGDHGNVIPQLLGVSRAAWEAAREETAKVLPDDGDVFDARFVDEKRDGKQLRDDTLPELRAQLMGRISFFEGHDASVYPTLRRFVIVRTHLSAHQFAEYSYQRATEIRREIAAKRRARGAEGGSGGAGGAAGAGSIGGGMVYRPFTRAVCNFAFPHDMPRPYRGVETASYEASLATAVARLRERPEQLQLRKSKSLASMSDKSDSSTRYTLEALSAKFAKVLQYLDGNEGGGGSRTISQTTTTRRSDPDYPLLEGGTAAASQARNTTKGNIPAIVYSQFRAAEGVSIFAEVLRANGYGELTCFNDASNSQLRVRREGGGNGGKASGPSFIVFSTDKPPEHNDLLLAVFNNRISELSSTVQNDLRAISAGGAKAGGAKAGGAKAGGAKAGGAKAGGAKAGGGRANKSLPTNLRGELAAVLLISRSGAEGLSTRNVRAVHVMEPFWHANRTEQVVGRARRAHSHDELPPEERFVDVYVHMATFSREQASLHGGDAGKTADEFVHDVAQNKRRLLRNVREVLRRASIEQQ
jgi:hypothetical protein